MTTAPAVAECARGTRSGALPPTATYAARLWSYTPVVPGDATDDRAGTLVILLRKGKSETSQASQDEYGVQETYCSTPGVRTFLLLNDTKPEDEKEDRDEIYETAFGPGFEKCSCKAGRCKLPCKHRAATAAVIAEGGI